MGAGDSLVSHNGRNLPHRTEIRDGRLALVLFEPVLLRAGQNLTERA